MNRLFDIVMAIEKLCHPRCTKQFECLLPVASYLAGADGSSMANPVRKHLVGETGRNSDGSGSLAGSHVVAIKIVLRVGRLHCVF